MKPEEGRYQLAYQVINNLFAENSPVGYIEENPLLKNSRWISKSPTHYYDHSTQSITRLERIIYLPKSLGLPIIAKPIGQRFNTLKELKDYQRENQFLRDI